MAATAGLAGLLEAAGLSTEALEAAGCLDYLCEAVDALMLDVSAAEDPGALLAEELGEVLTGYEVCRDESAAKAVCERLATALVAQRSQGEAPEVGEGIDRLAAPLSMAAPLADEPSALIVGLGSDTESFGNTDRAGRLGNAHMDLTEARAKKAQHHQQHPAQHPAVEDEAAAEAAEQARAEVAVRA